MATVFKVVLLLQGLEPGSRTGLLFVLHDNEVSFHHHFSDAGPSDPVRFIPSRVAYPDPPDWLTFLQRDSYQDGFLYGQPPATRDTERFPLEVILFVIPYVSHDAESPIICLEFV